MRFPLALFAMAALVPREAAAEPWDVNRALAGLPGMHRVMSAEATQSDIAVFAGAGYGFDNSVLVSDDSHHRATGSLAASVGLKSWLAFAVRFDGRYDRHDGVATGEGNVDDGLVGDPRLLVRGRLPVTDDWHAGAQLTAWFPGRQAPSVVSSAVSFDFLAAATYAPPASPLRVALNAGFRLDNSAASADDAFMLSEPDRLSLGVSDANAVILGVGAAYRLGRVEFVGESTWDVLIGDGAPSLRNSPLRVTAGVRASLSRAIVAQLMVETNLASHPAVGDSDPLVPFEPRFSVTAGLHYRFGAAPPPKLPDDDEDEPPPELLPAVLYGAVTDDAGGPLAGVQVSLEGARPAKQPATPPTGAAQGARPAAPTYRVDTDEQGGFRFADLAPGVVVVKVNHEGYEPYSQSVNLGSGEEKQVAVRLDPSLPPGQLRVYVRSFGGKGLQATVTVEPGGRIAQTNADGTLEIDLRPGDYEVEISAPGYQPQTKQVTIEEGAVRILNPELRRK